ncbi:hypothetical protein C8R46DRAFT_1213510 [Mycena filopes]|nr:hypothetical protein C8R46DRAFT_1213510 [Mycena filopes]
MQVLPSSESSLAASLHPATAASSPRPHPHRHATAVHEAAHALLGTLSLVQVRSHIFQVLCACPPAAEPEPNARAHRYLRQMLLHPRTAHTDTLPLLGRGARACVPSTHRLQAHVPSHLHHARGNTTSSMRAPNTQRPRAETRPHTVWHSTLLPAEFISRTLCSPLVRLRRGGIGDEGPEERQSASAARKEKEQNGDMELEEPLGSRVRTGLDRDPGCAVESTARLIDNGTTHLVPTALPTPGTQSSGVIFCDGRRLVDSLDPHKDFLTLARGEETSLQIVRERQADTVLDDGREGHVDVRVLVGSGARCSGLCLCCRCSRITKPSTHIIPIFRTSMDVRTNLERHGRGGVVRWGLGVGVAEES